VVDHVTHEYGPDAPESKQAILYADSLLGELMSGVEKLELPVNIIVVSDHGMFPMKGGEEMFLPLDEIMSLPKDSLRIVNNETHVHIYCDDPLKSRLINELHQNQSNYRAFLRENTPEAWQYNRNYRIGDIVIEAAPGYSFRRSARRARDYGSHGYDPYHTPEMQAIFYAAGPAIQPQMLIPSFKNIHVYPFIAYLLGIEQVESDGSAEVLKPILRK
jgi:alkaline phosphatase D